MENITELSGTLQTFFSTKASQVASLTKFARRKSPLTGPLFLLIVVVGFVREPTASYNQLAQVGLDLGLQISRQGIENRCTMEAVAFLRQMFAYSLRMLEAKWGLPLSLFQPFKGVYLLDSTQLGLPDPLAEEYPACGGSGKARKAGLKLQTLWEITLGQIIQVDEMAARQSDRTYTGYLSKLASGCLVLADMAYTGLERLQVLIDQGCYFICRFNIKCYVYWADDGKSLALLEYLKKCKATKIELEVMVGKEAQVRGRLIGVKLPVEAAQKRRVAALAEAKKKGRKAPTEILEWLDWNLYLTNAKREWLNAAQVVLFYRVRWQIELVFKLWKSGVGLERVAGKKAERIWLEIYAKLIGMVVLSYLSAPLRWTETLEEEGTQQVIKELSQCKALQSFQQEVTKIGQAVVIGARDELKKALAYLARKWELFGMKEHRKEHLTTCQRVAFSARNNGKGPPVGRVSTG